MKTIPLPLPTNATRQGPVVEFRNSTLVVKFDHEDEAGNTKWITIVFDETLAYEVRQSICLPAEDLGQTGRIQCVSESEWLSEVRTRWTRAVGWQEYQKQLGGSGRFTHYSLYFDDVCALQVIAANCNVSDRN